MSKILSDNTTMSGVHGNPRIDTKKRENVSIMTKMISIYCLTLDKWRPSWIFYPQCNVKNIFWQYHYVRHTWKPQDRHQKREYAFIISKMISIYCLTLDKWRPSWIFTQQCNVENIFGQCHCVGHTLKPYNRHQKHESASIVLNNISIYCLTLDKLRPFWILPTMQCRKLFLTTSLDREYPKTL